MVYHRPIAGQGEPFKLKSIRKEPSPAGADGLSLVHREAFHESQDIQPTDRLCRCVYG